MTTRVLIMDLGRSEQFEATLDYSRALVRSTQAGAEPTIEVDYIRTSNRLAISAALLDDAAVVHLMGHGVGSFRPALVSELDDRYKLSDQAAFSEALGVWPQAHCLLMDACNTWGLGWHRAVARCLPRDQELLYVGTTKSVSWAEATLFTGNFYASLLRKNLTGDLNSDWPDLQEACETAAEAYQAVAGRPAPFRWGWLTGIAASEESDPRS